MGDMTKEKRMTEEKKSEGKRMEENENRGNRGDRGDWRDRKMAGGTAKRRRKKAGAAWLTGCLILWGVMGGDVFPAFGSTSDTFEISGESQPEEHLVEISTEDMLKQWYDSRISGGDTIGVLSQNLTITKPVTLGLPEGQKEGIPVEIRIPQGPVRITAPRTVKQEGVLIDNPGLVITGEGSLFSLEGEGCLSLKRGQILRSKKEQPVLFLRNRSTLLWEEGKEFKGLTRGEIKDERTGLPSPDGGQTAPDQGGNSGPQLVEAVLLERNPDGSGSARLEFKNLPADITALYLWRSQDGHSWKQEKNKVTAISSQGGNETVEYENFLKEPGNTLNTRLLDDGYFIYHFEEGRESFYVKADIEWTGGSSETYKAKIVIPDSVGSGLTFSYGGSYGGGYWGGGFYGNGDYGSSGYTGEGNGGWDLSEEENPDSVAQEDAPERPVRRGRGKRRNPVPVYPGSYPLAASETKGKDVRNTASPSQIKRPWERDEAEKQTGSEETGEIPSGSGKFDGSGFLEEETADLGPQESLDQGFGEEPLTSPSGEASGSIWYIAGALAGGAGIFALFRAFRKKDGGKDSGEGMEK